MTPDPKLVEAVARALWYAHEEREVKEPWGEAGEHWQAWYRNDAVTALAAIPASGEWWIAPWILPVDDFGDSPSAFVKGLWALFREQLNVGDAHLKDTGTDK